MTPSTPPSPATAAHVATDNMDDLSLPVAVAHAVQFLCKPLESTYPASTLTALSATVTSSLEKRLSASTWEPTKPHVGSGYRSLIALPGVLPRPLREAAKTHGIDPRDWLRGVGENNKGEWELWIDPGLVSFREGGWDWEDAGFEPVVRVGKRDRCQTIWQAPSTLPQSTTVPAATSSTTANITPARVSRAIPIRAPTLFHIPPTPVAATEAAASAEARSPSPSLLPAFVQALPPRAGSPAESHSSASSSDDQHYNSDSSIAGRRHASNSSIASSISNQSHCSGNTMLLTPGPRPGSADPFFVASHTGGSAKGTTTPTTPTSGISGKTLTPGTATPAQTPGGSIAVQRYDGVNVGVLGGGVKLGGGGGSRPSSVARQPLGERSRSPSVSYPYSNPLSYGAPASPRKSHFGGVNVPSGQRTRRRIMPTYLGSVNAPGIPGPQGAFGQGMVHSKLPNGYPMPMPRMSGY